MVCGFCYYACDRKLKRVADWFDIAPPVPLDYGSYSYNAEVNLQGYWAGAGVYDTINVSGSAGRLYDALVLGLG